MIAVCLILYVALVIVSTVMHAASWRKRSESNPKSFIPCIAAGIAIFILFASLGDSASSGGYAYYINGVRTSSGVVEVGQSMFFGFMAAALAYGISIGIGYAFKKSAPLHESVSENGVSTEKLKKRPSVFVLILCFIGVWFGLTLFIETIKNVVRGASPWGLVVSLIFGIPIIVFSVIGIVRFFRHKK